MSRDERNRIESSEARAEERAAEQRSYLFLASAGVPHGEGSEVS